MNEWNNLPSWVVEAKDLNKVKQTWTPNDTISSSSVYSPSSDRVGLPPQNTPFSGVLMKSIGAAFFNVLPDVNHMRGMQYQIVLNIIFWPELN